MIKTEGKTIIMTEDEFDRAIMRAANTAANEVVKQLKNRLNSPRPQHVTQAEAARMIGVSKPTVARMIRFGTLSLNPSGKIPIDQIDAAIGRAA